MRSAGHAWGALASCVLAGVLALPAWAQAGGSQDQTVVPELPPPLPPKAVPKGTPDYEPIVPELPELPWGLPDDMLAQLQRRAATYADYARRFTCDETARLADYDEGGGVSKERMKKYAYLLYQSEDGERVREFRQEFDKDGKPRPAPVEDEEKFPPAYAWVFLFSEFNAPYFAFRLLDTRFEGFDYVHEVQFRGSSPFSSGIDIRQWEGRVLVDAFTFTPIEILAEPTAQAERVAAQFRIYNSSFSIIGFRTKPKPMGYRARIEFGLRRDGLTFPTELRYDTRRAVSPTQLVDVRASIRSYDRYLFTHVDTTPEMGDIRED